MPLTAEERAQLQQQIPHFDARPEYAYLAEKRLLPQQRDLASFEDPPFLTAARRWMFGLTQKEQNFSKQQQDALIPFQQEQKIHQALQPFLQAPLTELLASPMGQGIKATPEQIGMVPSGSMSVPQELVPSTFDIDELMARRPAGMTPSRINFGQPGSQVSQPMSEPVMPPTREVPTYSPGILPGTRPSMLQALQAQANLEPAVMAARERQIATHPVVPVHPGQPIYDQNTGRFITAPGTTDTPPATVSDENREALATFGRPYLQLSHPEQTQINTTLKAHQRNEDALAFNRATEDDAKTRIARSLAVAGFKESPFDETGQIDIAKLLAPGAVDMEKLTYWAQSSIQEPGLSPAVKKQMEFFYKQITEAGKAAKAAPAKFQATGAIEVPANRVEEYKTLRKAGKSQQQVLKDMGLVK